MQGEKPHASAPAFLPPPPSSAKPQQPAPPPTSDPLPQHCTCPAPLGVPQPPQHHAGAGHIGASGSLRAPQRLPSVAEVQQRAPSSALSSLPAAPAQHPGHHAPAQLPFQSIGQAPGQPPLALQLPLPSGSPFPLPPPPQQHAPAGAASVFGLTKEGLLQAALQAGPSSAPPVVAHHVATASPASSGTAPLSSGGHAPAGGAVADVMARFAHAARVARTDSPGLAAPGAAGTPQAAPHAPAGNAQESAAELARLAQMQSMLQQVQVQLSTERQEAGARISRLVNDPQVRLVATHAVSACERDSLQSGCERCRGPCGTGRCALQAMLGGAVDGACLADAQRALLKAAEITSSLKAALGAAPGPFAGNTGFPMQFGVPPAAVAPAPGAPQDSATLHAAAQQLHPPVASMGPGAARFAVQFAQGAGQPAPPLRDDTMAAPRETASNPASGDARAGPSGESEQRRSA